MKDTLLVGIVEKMQKKLDDYNEQKHMESNFEGLQLNSNNESIKNEGMNEEKVGDENGDQQKKNEEKMREEKIGNNTDSTLKNVVVVDNIENELESKGNENANIQNEL